MIPLDKLLSKYKLSSYNGPFTTKWIATDTEDRFNDNWDSSRNLRRQLIFNGYNDPNAITYDINELGFRIMPEVSNGSEFFLALGCSNTFGVGLNANDIWPAFLSAELDLNVYNAGVPGASVDQSYRIARALLLELKPKYVFHLASYETRKEIISDYVFSGMPYQFGGWNLAGNEFATDLPPEEKELVSAYGKVISGEVSIRLDYEKGCNAIAFLCHKHNVPYIELSLANPSPTQKIREGNYEPTARDLIHRGRDFQFDLANEMYNSYRKFIKNA